MNESQASRNFRVALTADFYGPDGAPRYEDLGLGVFQAEGRITHSPFAEHLPAIAPEQIQGTQGVIVLTPAVTAKTVSNAADLLAIGRFGVGYDAVDVAACTEADVLVFITAGAVDYSVAEATITWMLALSHRVRAKDILVREGRWNDRSQFMGSELRDRTLGVIGLGGIGKKLVELVASFGMARPLAFDPFLDPAVAQRLGIELVGLDELLTRSDFVSVNCPLTEKTRNLIGIRELSLMKPGAYLINTARGGIVDEVALMDVLRSEKIAGAGIDVFAEEPVIRPHPLGEFDNVLLAPHCIAWTQELFRDIGLAACRGMLDLAQGRLPRGVVNPQVLERPGFRSKWERLRLPDLS